MTTKVTKELIENPPVFTQYFESAEQAIISAGSLTIPHGLSVKPKLLQAVLICKTAEFGYSIGDEVEIGCGLLFFASTNRGVTLLTDATNIRGRYGLDTNVMLAHNFSTGQFISLTNANWRLKVKVFA